VKTIFRTCRPNLALRARLGRPAVTAPAVQERRAGPTRRFRAIAYGVPALAAVAAVATWMSPGRFVATGDVQPFEFHNLATELTALWNHQTVGSGAAGYPICRLFPVALAGLADAVGLSPVVAQYLYFVMIWSFAAFGGAYLAAVWIRRPVAVAAAGLLSAFNPFLLTSQPNALPALAIGLYGVLAGLLLRAGQGHRIRPILLAAATLPASYLAINPPLLAIVGVGVLATALGCRLLIGDGTRRCLRLLLRAAPWAILLNLWWLVPYAMTLTGMQGVAISTPTNVHDWSWSHDRSSLANVAVLNAQWGWDNPQYYPYRTTMEAYGSALLQWALPLLALLGILVADRRRRRLAWLLGLLSGAMIVLGTGLHPPFGGINAWIFDHVPGAWLLRAPATKLGVFQVLAYAVLASLAIDRLLPARATSAAERPARPAITPVPQAPARTLPIAAAARAATVVVLLLAALAHPWPLWTGAVVPEEKAPPMPGARVAIPPAWYAAATAVNTSPVPGKVLILPLMYGFYQRTTTWGYHGVDTVPAQLLSRPVVQPLPGAYFRAAGSADALAAGVQTALRERDAPAALRGLRALGVGQVVLRHDLVDGPAGRQQTPAALLRPGADEALTPTSRHPVATVYRVPGASGAVAAYATLATVQGNTDVGWHRPGGLPTAPTGTDPALPADEVRWRVGGDDGFTVPTPGRYSLARRGTAAFRVDLVGRGAGTMLHLSDATTVTVDGVRLPARPTARVPVTPGTEVVSVGGRLVASGEEVYLPDPAVLVPYVAERPNLLGDFGEAGKGCGTGNAAHPRAVVERPRPDSVRVSTPGGHACVAAAVHATATGPHLLTFRYRGPGRICLLQPPTRCAALPPLRHAPGWQRYTAVVELTPDTPLPRLVLQVGPVAGRADSTVEYHDVLLRALRSAKAVTVRPPEAPAVTRALTAGRHTVRIGGRAIGSLEAADGPAKQHQLDARVRPEHAAELFARELPALHRFQGHVRRSAGAALGVDGFELAEQVTRAIDRQHDLPTVGRDLADLHAAGDDDEDGLAVIALDDDGRTTVVPARSAGADQSSAVRRVEQGEEARRRPR
jgi:arabinofuranan 3-O-arabinosyltransferase